MRTFQALMTVLTAGVLGGVCETQAQGGPPVVIETVVVGNPGNAGDSQSQGVFGAVDYVYAIGKYEVTAGQYARFLNAVAATDPHALYDEDMWTHAQGCKIERTGSPGSYRYGVAPDWANRPVNFVSWGDAARFANWLHNGQPTGAQDLTTTEDGSYFLNGMTGDSQLEDVVRKPDATWVIPTEDEWYKAAYHKNDGVTGNYWRFPTGTDAGLSNDLIDTDPGNHATYSRPRDYTIGAPYYRTEVGAHVSSASPYGTFDQGGNVQEFNETVPEPDIRGIRGGSWFWGLALLSAAERPFDMHTSDQWNDLGFRVARLAGTSRPPCDLPLGHPDFCRECGPCGSAQGGCKNDDECSGSLLCAESFGPQFGLGVDVGVCVEPRSVELEYRAVRLPEPADEGVLLERIHARAINDRGQVAGWAASADGSRRRAFLFTPQIGIETIAVPGDQSSEAIAINDAGDVFGRLVRVRADGSVVQTGLFRHRAGEALDQLTRGSNASIRAHFELRDVNQAGDVVGVLHRNREPRRVPYLYTEGERWIRLAALDARLRGRSVLPIAINDAADVLFATLPAPSGVQEAYLLRGGNELFTLGNFGRRVNAPFDLNAQGQVVGFSETGEGGAHAYSVKPGRALTDLHRGRFTSSFAGWVNSRGVVGGVFDDEALFTYDQRRAQKVRVVASRRDFARLLGDGAKLDRIEVFDMNERIEFVGRVVGELDGGDAERFLYFNPAVGVLDLGEVVSKAGAGASFEGVRAINDRGAILLELNDAGTEGALVISPLAR
jgi:probable HAF family extracellular repeat protein